MKTFHSKVELINEFRNNLQPGVVAVDGFDRVGKTTFAEELAEATGLECISVDVYMSAGRDSYIESLRYNELCDRIDQALSVSNRVVVEGIVLSDVLRKLEITPAVTVYVKGTVGEQESVRWIHEDLLREGADPEKLRDAKSNTKSVGGIFLNYLHLELVPYHLTQQPHISSNFVLTTRLPNFFG